MPTRVQSRPAELTRTFSETYHDHDPINQHKNLQHKEALRLALGSILTPKRPFTPSRSPSGTASPAHSASFTASSSPQPPPPHSTPTHGHNSDAHMQARYIHHPHTPSRLGLGDPTDPHGSSSSPFPHHPSRIPSTANSSQQPSPSQETPPPLSLPASMLPGPEHQGTAPIHAPSPHSAVQSGVVVAVPHAGSAGSGTGTPKAKFIETLQSKSAWDALIHGSFS